jgi:hypothetical protein
MMEEPKAIENHEELSVRNKSCRGRVSELHLVEKFDVWWWLDNGNSSHQSRRLLCHGYTLCIAMVPSSNTNVDAFLTIVCYCDYIYNQLALNQEKLPPIL